MPIDSALGRLGIKQGLCTSSTRPANPFEGQVIYESDTNRTLVYDNAAWVVVADNQVLSIDAANSRVGIGTTSPDEKLTVTDGHVLFEAATDSGTVNIVSKTNAANAGNKIAFFAADRHDTDEEMAYIRPYLQTNSGGSGNVQLGRLAFGTSGSERMRIDSDGNVGIGTTSPRNLLEVQGSSSGSVDEVMLLAANGSQVLGSGARLHLSGGNGTGRSVYIEGVNTGGATNAHAMTFGTSNNSASPVERMRIDSSGRVTMPYQPAFKAYGTSGDYTSGVLPYPNVVYNIGNHYNSTLSRFVAPVAGVYPFHAQAYRRLASADDEVAMRVNGSDVTRSRTSTSGAGYANNHMTELLYLNVGDYVDCDVALNGAHLNASLFSFHGFLVA